MATAKGDRVAGQLGQVGDMVEAAAPARWTVRLLQRSDIGTRSYQRFGNSGEIGADGRIPNQ